MEFHLQSQLRARELWAGKLARIKARRFLEVPELPTDFAAFDSGRGPLVQIRDFEKEQS
jgi:hypothetical protein